MTEVIILLQKALIVHSSSSVQIDTKFTSFKPDNKAGSTYVEYLNETFQDVEKFEQIGPPLNETFEFFVQNLVYNDINVENKIGKCMKEYLKMAEYLNI